MARIVYRKEQIKSNALFPISIELDHRIDVTHPVRIINSVVEKLDLSALISSYKGGGTSSYNPRTLH